MRSSDWSSDVCSSDLVVGGDDEGALPADHVVAVVGCDRAVFVEDGEAVDGDTLQHREVAQAVRRGALVGAAVAGDVDHLAPAVVAVARQLGQGELDGRSEEHTSELQSLMRISYAVFCLKTKTHTPQAQ